MRILYCEHYFVCTPHQNLATSCYLCQMLYFLHYLTISWFNLSAYAILSHELTYTFCNLTHVLSHSINYTGKQQGKWTHTENRQWPRHDASRWVSDINEMKCYEVLCI